MCFVQKEALFPNSSLPVVHLLVVHATVLGHEDLFLAKERDENL